MADFHIAKITEPLIKEGALAVEAEFPQCPGKPPTPLIWNMTG